MLINYIPYLSFGELSRGFGPSDLSRGGGLTTPLLQQAAEWEKRKKGDEDAISSFNLEKQSATGNKTKVNYTGGEASWWIKTPASPAGPAKGQYNGAGPV